jgi:hypothetical protein
MIIYLKNIFNALQGSMIVGLMMEVIESAQIPVRDVRLAAALAAAALAAAALAAVMLLLMEAALAALAAPLLLMEAVKRLTHSADYAPTLVRVLAYLIVIQRIQRIQTMMVKRPLLEQLGSAVKQGETHRVGKTMKTMKTMVFLRGL